MEQKKIKWLIVSLWVMAFLALLSNPQLWPIIVSFAVTITFIVTYKNTRW